MAKVFDHQQLAIINVIISLQRSHIGPLPHGSEAFARKWELGPRRPESPSGMTRPDLQRQRTHFTEISKNVRKAGQTHPGLVQYLADIGDRVGH